MKYNEYETAFSSARLNKYIVACNGNNNKALVLYRHNIKLCQKFYGVLICMIKTNLNPPMTKIDVTRFGLVIRKALTKNYSPRERKRMEERKAQMK